jgi:hypothetical protein
MDFSLLNKKENTREGNAVTEIEREDNPLEENREKEAITTAKKKNQIYSAFRFALAI